MAYQIKHHDNKGIERLTVGAKAEGLLFLTKNGFKVPDFFLIDVDTIAALVNGKISAQQLINDWKNNFNLPPDSLWAFRSSGIEEDGEKQSFAGLFTTLLNLTVDQLPEALEEIVKLNDSANFNRYAENFEPVYGLVLQQMLRPEYSGVIFSVNPTSINDNCIVVNVVPGLGSELVSGKETACVFKIKNRKAVFNHDNETYKGSVFTHEYEAVQASKDKIIKDFKAHIKSLSAGTLKIAEIKKKPVDLEFAITKNTLYWLQVRPITTIQNKNIEGIWDNANIGENYPGLTLPLTISFVKYTYQKAYTNMSLFLGMSEKQIKLNTPLFANMVGGINGALYYQVTAWQKLLYQLPFGKYTSRIITRLWVTDSAEFQKPKHSLNLIAYFRLLFNLLLSIAIFSRIRKRYLKVFEYEMAEITKVDFSALSISQIYSRFCVFELKIMKHWVAPLINGFYTLIFYALCKYFFKHSRLKDKYPNFINDVLFEQGDIVSVKIVRDFQQLILLVQQNNELKKTFSKNSETKLLEHLKISFPDYYTQFSAYIEAFGERCEEGELKFETINFKEDPLKLLKQIKICVDIDSPILKKIERMGWQTILIDTYKQNFLKKYLWRVLIKITTRRFRDRENFRFMRTQAVHKMREIFNVVDKKLLEASWIENSGDSLYLTMNEIFINPNSNQFKNIVEQRKLEYKNYQTIHLPNRYHKTNLGWEAIIKTPVTSDTKLLNGTGCSSGIIKGQVHFFDHNSRPETIMGKILVAKYFEPGSVHLFSYASGILSERGNLLSHTAILCREMGIPSIVGIKNLLNQLKNDDWIQMDGASGKITLLQNES